MARKQLKQVIYTSTAAIPFTQDELRKLMEVSRRNNRRRKITGMLLYDVPQFLQVIEGPPEQIDELVNRLKSDTRHRDFRVQLEQIGSTEREFGDWEMGCKLMIEGAPSELEHLSKQLHDALVDTESTPGERFQQLLYSYRRLAPSNVDI